MRRRPLVVVAGAACVLWGCAAPRESEPPAGSPAADSSWRELLGAWETTAGQRSLVLSICEDGHALVLVMQPGQHSARLVRWAPLHEGILIQDVTRIRLWRGRHPRELRAEFEIDPERPTAAGEFPATFGMVRIGDRRIPAELLDRPLPAHWTEADADVSDAAGRR